MQGKIKVFLLAGSRPFRESLAGGLRSKNDICVAGCSSGEAAIGASGSVKRLRNARCRYRILLKRHPHLRVIAIAPNRDHVLVDITQHSVKLH